MDGFLQDLRYGIRRIGTDPAFAAVATLCLAVGIGANAAVFSLVRALDPGLPGVHEPSRLVSLWLNREQDVQGVRSFSWLDYVDLRDVTETLEDLAAFGLAPVTLTVDEKIEQDSIALVTANYFATLGVEAAVGRNLLESDFVPSASSTPAVVSHGVWTRRFGRDPDVVGREFEINGHPVRVVGVAAADFRGTHPVFATGAWVPVTGFDTLFPDAARLGGDTFSQRDLDWLQPVGRLRVGDLGAVNSEMAVLAGRLSAARTDEDNRMRITVHEGLMHPSERARIRGWSMFAGPIAAAVLLIACVNVASLLMAKAGARRREIAVRRAMGCSRPRLVRQLCLESTSLVVFGGVAAGAALAWGHRLLPRLVPYFPRAADSLDVAPDGRVLAFTALLCLLALPTFALGPALSASGEHPQSALKETARTRRGRIWTRGMVLAQVAMAVSLLLVAGLFIRSVQAFWQSDPGFEPDGLLLATVDVSSAGLDSDGTLQFYRTLQLRLESLPGVEAVSLGMQGPRAPAFTIELYGRGAEAQEPGGAPINAFMNLVSQEYFRAAGLRLLRGRDRPWPGEPADRLGIVINEALAQRLWGDDDPLGDSIVLPGHPYLGTEDHVVDVIGIVDNPTGHGLETARLPALWAPLALAPESVTVWPPAIHLRVAGAAGEAAPSLRQLIMDLAPGASITSMMTGTEWQGWAVDERRQAAVFAGGYALLAMVLAALGIYGTIAHAVSERMYEIGVRIAVGAGKSQIVRAVLSEGLVLALAGGALGTGIGVGAARLLRAHIPGVAAHDPVTVVAVLAMVAVVSATACYLPARRAARTDPLVALRAQ